MHIVVGHLDKKVENLKMVIDNFTSSLFRQKIYSDVPLTRGFPTIPTLLSLVKFLKGYKGW